MKNYKELNNIAVPLILQAIAGIVIGLCDQAMIGRISIEAYGAVGVISSLLYLITGVLGLTAVTFNIKASEAIGNNNKDEYKDELSSTLLLNIVIGSIFFVLIIVFGDWIIRLLYDFRGDIFSAASNYFMLMAPYVILQLLLFVFSSNFKVKRKTKYILYGSVSSSILNVVLNYCLIYGNFGAPKLGVKGAAIATIISLSINLIYYYVLSKEDIGFDKEKIDLYMKKMKDNFIYSLPLIGEEFVDGFIFVTILNVVVARIGAVELSTYLILNQFLMIIMIPAFMYGSALLSLISEKKNKSTPSELQNIAKDALKLSLLFYVVISIVLIIFREIAPLIITTDGEVAKYTSQLIAFVLFCNVFKLSSITYKSALQSIDCASYILKMTIIINSSVVLVILGMNLFANITLISINIVLVVYYLAICLVFKRKFKKEC